MVLWNSRPSFSSFKQAERKLPLSTTSHVPLFFSRVSRLSMKHLGDGFSFSLHRSIPFHSQDVLQRRLMLGRGGVAGQFFNIGLRHVTKGDHADGLPDTKTDSRDDTAV